MKKKLYLLAVVTMMGQISCGEFLKQTSGDLLIPKNVSEFTALLNGEGYPNGFTESVEWMNLMTDDIDMSLLTATYDEGDNLCMNAGDGLWPFSWKQNIEEKITDGAWDMCYKRILGCNTIIQALPTMVYDENEVDLYNSLAASAYSLRAYYYFCLVNWYALPYSKDNLSKLGVIIKTIPNVTLGQFERNTIGEVYKLINDDITKAKEYSKNGRPTANKFIISDKAINFLSNRIALFQENWDQVIEEGEIFMRVNNKLFDLKSADKSKFGLDSKSFVIMNTTDNPEIIFSFGGEKSYKFLNTSTTMFSRGFVTNKNGDNSLISLYVENDLRLSAYYKIDQDVYWVFTYLNNFPLKYTGIRDSKGYRENWRNVEVFLNVAEAYARRDAGINGRAVEILNTIRQNRFDTGYIPLEVSDFSSKEALVKFVWDERRRELSFEETMRWWDIRRQGCKQITHRYYINKTSFEIYILPEKSPNFVLQIPASESGVNDVITPNERELILNK